MYVDELGCPLVEMRLALMIGASKLTRRIFRITGNRIRTYLSKPVENSMGGNGESNEMQ